MLSTQYRLRLEFICKCIANGEEVKLDDINLSTQMVGEVQAFIFTMRWVLYEFYSFKKMKKEGLLSSNDFD